MRSTLALLATLGCYSGPDDATDCEHGVRHQCAAERAVWHGLFGETGPAPRVAWRDYELTNPESGEPTIGLYFDLDDTIELTQRDKLANTGYPHELLHAHLFRITGDADTHHKRPEWGAVMRLAYYEIARLEQPNPMNAVWINCGMSACHPTSY